MKAIVIYEPGGPEKLIYTEVPRPKILPHRRQSRRASLTAMRPGSPAPSDRIILPPAAQPLPFPEML